MERTYASILASLQNYEASLARNPFGLTSSEQDDEKAIVSRFYQFLNSTSEAFSRLNMAGHLTGSAFVVDRQYQRIVLTHHAKLGKWVQLGGHVEHEICLSEVALREAYEESGLRRLALLSPPLLPLDFAIHEVPVSKGVPAHLHYDISYGIVAYDEDLLCSDESIDVRWFTFAEALQICEPKMHRCLYKLEAWLKTLSQ